MKKLLLILLLLVVAGCASQEEMERRFNDDGRTNAERSEITANRKAMLVDGRIRIGMTAREFANLWEKPDDSQIDRSTSAYGITEWWRFNWDCRTPTHYRNYYHFCFENGILDYWSEN